MMTDRAGAIVRALGPTDYEPTWRAMQAFTVARADDTTPRAVFEAYFRRSVTDEEWRDRYAELFA